MQICRGVYGFQSKAFPALGFDCTALPLNTEKNHKQTAFHIGMLSCQHKTILKNLNTQYYLGYRIVPETLYRIACVCSTVYVF